MAHLYLVDGQPHAQRSPTTPAEPAAPQLSMAALANAYCASSQPEPAEPPLRRQLRTSTERGDRHGVYRALYSLARVAFEDDRIGDAVELVEQALAAVAGLQGEAQERPLTAVLAARIYRAADDPDRACRLLDALDLPQLAAAAPLQARQRLPSTGPRHPGARRP
jgi:hypothetical protein